MPRIVPWPIGLGVTSVEPLNGPSVTRSGSTDSLGGFNQSVSGIGFLWEFAFTFPPMSARKAREFRGWITVQHSGANATVYTLIDGDKPKLSEFGLPNEGEVPFSNGENFSNGQPWSSGYPTIALTAAAELGATEITLPDTLWGHKLGIGTWIGFMPLHLGMYMITQVHGDGRYRIFPELRKAVSVGDFATLTPSVCMRMRSPEAASSVRGVSYVENASYSAVEVLDYDARDFFTG